MANSPTYDLPLITDQQNDAATTHNDSVNYLEVLVGGSPVISRTTVAQPGAPTEGDAYIVGPSATGSEWTGHDDEFGVFSGGVWVFIVAVEGNRAYAQDENRRLIWTGTAWIATDGPEQTLTDAATVDWDANVSPNATVTLTASRNMATPTNLMSGQFYKLEVIQGGAGSFTLTFSAGYELAGGSVTLTTAAGSVDELMFFNNGTVLREVSRSLDVQ